MYHNAVKYKDGWLAPGSHAMELYNAKKFKELDAHCKLLHTKWLKETGRTE